MSKVGPVLVKTNAHQYQCIVTAADHISEAIAILLAANLESTEAMIAISELKAAVKHVASLR